MTIGLLGGGHPGTFALRFQFEKSAPVVLRHDLDEGTERVVPVFEEGAGAGAAGEEMVTLDQDAQTLRIEAQGVAHAVIDDIRRALAQAVFIVVVPFVRQHGFERDLFLIAQPVELAFWVPHIRRMVNSAALFNDLVGADEE